MHSGGEGAPGWGGGGGGVGEEGGDYLASGGQLIPRHCEI